MRFLPASPDSGIVFVRTDLPGTPAWPARYDLVTDTQRRTTIGPPRVGVTLVEHVLASLAGLRIDNCVIEIDGPEPPGLDGSSNGFVTALSTVSTRLQPARRAIWTVDQPVLVSHKGSTVGLHPHDSGVHPHELRISYILDYGMGGPIPRQAYTYLASPDSFVREVADCRTFLLEKEAAELKSKGVGTHLTLSDLLVFGPNGPIGNNLRFADEPARHKVLDLVGDLSLCGFDLAGHVVAYRSGHALNVALATALAAKVADLLAAPTRVLLPSLRMAA